MQSNAKFGWRTGDDLVAPSVRESLGHGSQTYTPRDWADNPKYFAHGARRRELRVTPKNIPELRQPKPY